MLRGLDQLMERKEGGGMYLLWVSLIGDVRTLMMDEAHASRYLVHSGADKTYYDLRDMYGGHVWRRILLPIYHSSIQCAPFEALFGRKYRSPVLVEVGDKVMLEVSSWKDVLHFGKKDLLAPRYYWTDANLHVHLEEIKVDKTLCFAEEPVEIIDCEVKSLKRSRILIVKSIGTRSEWLERPLGCIGSSQLISFRILLHEFLNVFISDSLLLTPLCCDDIHDVTPRVFALAGCDTPQPLKALFDSRKAYLLEEKQIPSVGVFDEVFSTWMTFGGNTRDLASFGEETDKTTALHQESIKPLYDNDQIDSSILFDDSDGECSEIVENDTIAHDQHHVEMKTLMKSVQLEAEKTQKINT
ncbi:hypothetical protein Tco_1156576 [Tanacetum coccineum]